MKIHARNGVLYLRRHVPLRYADVEPRREVWVSLGTDSPAEARDKAARVWAQMVAAWEAKRAGDTSDAEARFEAARDLAKARGFRYLPVERVARLPVDEIIQRVEAIGRKRDGRLDMLEAAAFLGGAQQPAITVTRALDLFWTLAADRSRGKSEYQLRIWRNCSKRAVANFVAVIGDLPVEQITADDMLDFREWWWQRITEEGLSTNTANKDFTHLANVLRTVNTKKRLGLTLPITGLAFREDDQGQRPSFTEDWIRSNLVQGNALAGLNTEARCILLGMVNTGYRPSEGAGLLPEHIHLDCDHPHIEILPVGRALKSKYSRRIIPLCGVSLEAFKSCPDAFPRYRNRQGLSNIVNKYLRNNFDLPSPGHTMYSLRHSFEDRLLHADADDRIRRDLMGHRLNRERYGEGASLAKLHEVVSRIAL